jgi:hypothetical protein
LGGRAVKVNRMRWLGISLVAVLTVSAAARAAWNSHQRKAHEERHRQLTNCHPSSCDSGFKCALTCARQFVERNGYGDPTLARPAEAVFDDVVEWMHGDTREKALAARARSFRTDPLLACERKDGYEFLFADAGSANGVRDVEGKLLTMDRSFSNIHLHHEVVIVRLDPESDECRVLR